VPIVPVAKPLPPSSYNPFYKPKVYRRKLWAIRLKWRIW
jgi:hypothetical protein